MYLNLFCLVSGYIFSRISRRVIHWGQPVALSIEPTNHCNLHCTECPSGTASLRRSKGVMDLSLYKRILDQLPSLLHLNLYFQGEPYLHPEFTTMIREAKARGIYVSSSTNGHYMDARNALLTVRSGLDELIISLDGCDNDTYKQYRVGGDFDKVVRGIREIVSQKTKCSSHSPKIILQFLVLKTNLHQTSKIKALGKELGADKVVLKTAQINDFKNGNALIPEGRYSRYKSCNGSAGNQFVIGNHMPNHCFRMWSSCVITWDGVAVPCCFDKDGKYAMGDMKKTPFSEVWNSLKYNDFRKIILTSRKSIDICTNCSEGSGLSYLF